MKLIYGKSELKKKYFQVAVGAIFLMGRSNAQNKEIYPDTLNLWAPNNIYKLNQFNFLIQGDYKLVSENSDTLILSNYCNQINGLNIPVQIIVDKKDKTKGIITIDFGCGKREIKLLSEYVFFENNVFSLKLNPGGEIHKTFKIGHKSHMSHRSHYSSVRKYL